MKLSGRRLSTNVEDRRGNGGKVAGLSIGGVIIAGILALLLGGNPGDVIQQLGSQTATTGEYTPTEQEEQLKTFALQVLASTEDVWSAVFKQKFNATYTPPTLVIFKGQVQTNCGGATSAVGPFYCSADQKLYLDLAFFEQMERQLKSGGDFARAYVIAHEVGHHVENLLGILGKAHSQMSQVNKTQANQISVRLELLADYYSGVWAHYEDEAFGSLDDSDMKEAINCAQHIGDNYLQEQAQGYSQPESFTHGTSEQRMRWLKRGYQTGDMSVTTFSGSYNSL